MHKRSWLAFGLTVLVLGLVALLVARQLARMGYLPRAVRLTADPAPTSVPLPTATAGASLEAPSVVPSATPSPDTPEDGTPSPAATPARETSPDTPSPISEGAPTRVVPPPEPLLLPDGFGISVFAEGLSGPRMMTVGPGGALYLAERGANRIVRLPDRDADGVADRVEVVAGDLSSPSSLAFHPDGTLYVGEPARVLRLTLAGDPLLSVDREIVVDGLPTGGHNTRTVLVSPDGTWLYVSVGSSCNVCDEDDARRASIVRYRPDGSEESLYAVGLRNAVGITFRPGTSDLWATNNGRDWLGDDLPPETVYLVGQGDDAGWPRCHSGRIPDPEFGGEGACGGVITPVIELQAHTAPLGLGFYTGLGFPEAYAGDLFVALHGSWNRSTPVGYKVVRVPIDGGRTGEVEDFVSGWLREDGSQWGRPVDVVTAADGSLLVSDDGAGRIYRVFYAGQ